MNTPTLQAIANKLAAAVNPEAQALAKTVWDAYGAVAFVAPSGNMLCTLVNLAAARKEKE